MQWHILILKRLLLLEIDKLQLAVCDMKNSYNCGEIK